MRSATKSWVVALVLLAGCLVAGPALAAGPNAMAILTKAMSLHRSVRDYTANVTVTTNIPEIEIPQRTAKVYVKPPDKTYVESRGIVFIPKRALLFGDLAKEIGKEAKVLLAGTSKAGGKTVYCVKILPKSKPAGDKSDPRALVWVNGANWTLQRMEMRDGAKVMMRVDFSHVQVQGFWMPAKVSATVPKGIMGSDKEGRVSLAFANYKVNTGLTDEFFQKMEAKQKRQQHGGPSRPRRHP